MLLLLLPPADDGDEDGDVGACDACDGGDKR